MSSTFTPTTHTVPTGTDRQPHTAPQDVLRPIVFALSAFVVIAAIGLCVALIAGATAVFNLLVFVLFAVLWLGFIAALVFTPGTLDQLWGQIRRLPLILQGTVWLLFLPLIIGLWIWERDWSSVIRLVLVLGIGFANIVMFLPKGS